MGAQGFLSGIPLPCLLPASPEVNTGFPGNLSGPLLWAAGAQRPRQGACLEPALLSLNPVGCTLAPKGACVHPGGFLLSSQPCQGEEKVARGYGYGVCLMWQNGSSSSLVCEVSGHRRTSHLDLVHILAFLVACLVK